MSQGANESANKRQFEFEIGETFPADDPVARFVVVLAMVSNDWHRLTRLMVAVGEEPDEEGRAVRLMLLRYSAATHSEARDRIAQARSAFPNEIEPFVAGLNVEAQQQLAILDAPLSWLKPHRNVTFHYPELHPNAYAAGEEEIGEALKAAASERSSITGGTFGNVRFAMADVAALALLVGDIRDEERMRKLVKSLSEATIALGMFVQLAFDAYYEMHKQRFGTPREIA